MFLKKPGAAAGAVWALAFVAIGVGVVARVAADGPESPREEVRGRASRPPEDGQARPVPAFNAELGDDSWPLSLRDAIRIGLENAKGVRLVAAKKIDPTDEIGLVIAPTDPEVKAHRFRAEVMAGVRSIEHLYWDLAWQYVRLWAEEKAAAIAEDVFTEARDTMKFGRDHADVEAAALRLEQFRLDLSARPFDVITAERRLRKVLGLVPDDGRRIVPVSVPVEAKREPDRDACLAVMLEKQPDVVEAKERAKVRKAKQADLDAITQTFLPDLPDNGPLGLSREPATGNSVLPESTALEQTTRQATHALTTSILQLAADYKHYQTAKWLRAAALERLNTRRALHDEGRNRITIDRLLDAVSQYAWAVALEAQSKSNYNNAIIDLEEAEGTLLEYDKITVAETSKAPPPAKSPAGREPSRETREAKSEPPGAAASGRTVSFQATISVGSIPFEIRGSFTVAPAAPLGGASKP